MPLKITNATTDVAVLNRWADGIETTLSQLKVLHQRSSQQIVNAVSSISGSVSLTIPNTFTPTTQTGNALAFDWLPEPGGWFLAGPAFAGLASVDSHQAAVDSLGTLNMTTTATFSTDWAFVVTGSGGTIVTPGATPSGWTIPASGSAGAGKCYYRNTNALGVNTVTQTYTNGGGNPFTDVGVMTLFGTQGGSPAFIQNTTFPFGGTGSAFVSANTAGNSILVVICGQTNNTGHVTAITDTLGNTYNQIDTAALPPPNLGLFPAVNGEYCALWLASNIVGGSGNALTLTVSGTCAVQVGIAYEITNLSAVPQKPVFRPINQTDIPVLDINKKTSGNLSVLRLDSGTNAAQGRFWGGDGHWDNPSLVDITTLNTSVYNTGTYTTQLQDVGHNLWGSYTGGSAVSMTITLANGYYGWIFNNGNVHVSPFKVTAVQNANSTNIAGGTITLPIGSGVYVATDGTFYYAFGIPST